MRYLKNKGIPEINLKETIQELESKLCGVLREGYMLENAIAYLKEYNKNGK